MLRRYVRDEHSAEDIHQATFEVIVRRLRERGIDDPGRIKQFIRQTAMNLAKGEFRKRDRQQTFADSELVANTPDRGRSLFDRIEREQLLAVVRRMIEELPIERDRDIFRRFYIFGERRAAICDVLDLGYDHFDRVMYRARQRLKALASAEFGDGLVDDD